MSVVVFNWATSTANPATATPETAWSLLFPELASYVAEDAAAQFFALAGFFCDNSGSGQIRGGAPAYQLDICLNYIAAHLAKTYAILPNGSTPSPLVGRIDSATQGSISVQASLVNNPSMAMAFFAQTQYGLTYWTMSQQYRTGFYVPGPCASPGGLYAVYPRGAGFLDPWSSGPGYG